MSILCKSLLRSQCTLESVIVVGVITVRYRDNDFPQKVP